MLTGMATGMASGLGKAVTMGGKMVLQNLGVLENNKRHKQINKVKNVLSQMTYQTILPEGEYYLDLSTGKTLKQIPKVDLPRKIVVFSCGGGSFVEYEFIKNLNQELGCRQFNDSSTNSTGGLDGLSAPARNTYFD